MPRDPYLKEIAAFLLKSGNYNLPETCVIFPNKRARLFLSKYLSELSDTPMWAPGYLTINEFMETASGYVYADHWFLVFELYSAYKEITDSKESFDAFYPNCETLLHDFDELDKYLVDADELFSNLSGLKEIEGRFGYLSEEQIAAIQRFWGTLHQQDISEYQTLFLSLWEKLPAIYHAFRNKMEKANRAYEGMAYKKVARTIKQNGFEHHRYKKYLFIGFNALNRCEEELFTFLKSREMADFFWDYDNWYIGKEAHEAGYFMRNNIKKFPEPGLFDHSNMTNDNKKIYYLPVPSNRGQAGMLSFLFNHLGITDSSARPADTAIVLADENLLIPVIYAIPGYVDSLNISLSFPVAGSPVFHLVEQLHTLLKNSRRTTGGSLLMYYKDVLEIMDNPLLSNIYGEKKKLISKRVYDGNMVYLKYSDLQLTEGNDLIFNQSFEDKDVCKYFKEVLTRLLNYDTGDTDSGKFTLAQNEILLQVYNLILRLDDFVGLLDYRPNANTMLRIIKRMIRSIHIPFSGEPLSGLQVLGLLETRTLDFRHVIILSANEGILPKTDFPDTFIPQSLRNGFGLPTIGHSDAMYAYYFYRLLHRAESVSLVYDSSTGGLRTGERSRFMHQLYYESNFSMTEITPEFLVSNISIKPVIIEKRGVIADKLREYTAKDGRILSPSALNEFIRCPLRFCFHHIVQLPEPDEVTEEVDARLFGNIFHKAMNIIYSDFGHKRISPGSIDAVLKNDKLIVEAIGKAYALEFPTPKNESSDPKGYNLIVLNVIKTYIRQLLEAEKSLGPFEILGLEEKVTYPMEVKSLKSPVYLNLGGVIDRIDLYDSRIRIIDYKTGKAKEHVKSIVSLFDAEEKSRNEAAFQVLLYSFMYSRIKNSSGLIPALYYTRKSHSNDFSFWISIGSKKEIIDNYAIVDKEFESQLHNLAGRLLDLDEPFTQTTNVLSCRYCPYAAICRRHD